ncbi:MAG TPA: hypothetical protein VHK65_06370 [Candidatus Dormibacteraeota bacterium]|nr:hypothetical protein [Candidatus Dormibacteraeota bacterium]
MCNLLRDISVEDDEEDRPDDERIELAIELLELETIATGCSHAISY